MTAPKQKIWVFNDPIHGCIEMHPLCVKIIDTPQFQRLRCIKQLGGASYVYPGAVHTRFEHSIGVCHLAGQLVRSLRVRQPELDITDTDVLCVEIAGLCHDLGQGPYSHMFEAKVIPRLVGETSDEHKHEHFSRLLFEYIIEENNLKDIFKDNKLRENEIEFIKDLFGGTYPNGREDDRSGNKPFLYEIVANKSTGIDVDKWDYFARDCHMLGVKNNFDHQRCIKMARVEMVDGRPKICFRDKEVHNLYDMFYTRYTLHKRAYQHKVVKVVERMITDAMVKGLKPDAIKFKGKNGARLSLKEAIERKDLQAYCQMTDNIINQIRQSESTDESVVEAQNILHRIDTRNMYVLAGEKLIEHEHIIEEADMDIDAIEQYFQGAVPGMPKETAIVENVYFDYGKKDRDPLENSSFYDKDFKIIPVAKDKVSHLLPTIFREQLIRVFCKDEQFKREVGDAFNAWCTSRFKKTASKDEIRERTAKKQKSEVGASNSKLE